MQRDVASPEISVVIPTFNRLASLRRCLDSLQRVPSPALTIVVVDDGSRDGTADCMRRDYPSVTLLLGDGNLWWSQAMNIGCRYAVAAGATWVLVMNDDNQIEHDAIAALVETSRQNPDAVVGSKVLVLSTPQTIWSAGGTVCWPWPGTAMRGYYEPDRGQFETLSEVDWLPGMGTLIRTEHLKQLGYYDARHLPQVWADTDFTLRARKNGLRVLYEPRSRLINDTSTTGLSAQARTAKEFWQTLVHLRSRLRVRSTAWFYLHHCPVWWLPVAYGLLYGRHAASWIKRMLRTHSARQPQ